MVARTMGNSKPPKNRKELLRRRKIKKSWTPRRKAAERKRMAKLGADPDYKRKVSEGVKKALANPEFCASQTAHLRKAEADPGACKRKSDGIKKSWTADRRKAQRVRMVKLRADPVASARRKAGVDAKWRDPEYRDRMDAAKKKSEARPKLRALRKAQCRKMNADPEVSARRSASRKKARADLLAYRAAQKEIAKTEKRRRGAPPKEERDKRAVELAGLGWLPRAIAKEIEPEAFAVNSKNAIGKIRKVLEKWRKSKKTGDSHDEPEILHDGRSLEGGGREETHAAALDQNRQDIAAAGSPPSQQSGEAVD
jgi:hypothetical protein